MPPSASTPGQWFAAHPGAGRAALAFVLATLVALVVVPVAVQARVSQLREEIEVSEPARTLVSRLQFNLSREMAALSDRLLTGSEISAATYAASRAAESEIFLELEPLATRLGPEVSTRLADVRAITDRWHERVADEEILRRGAAGASLEELPRERHLFEDLLRTTVALDSVIIERTARTRAEIVTAERTGLWLTLLLGVLALFAAGGVAALYTGARRYAAEAERGRRRAEAALAEAARANEARTRLLRGITHDVKNPLGAAKGYAELLEMGIKAPILPEQTPLVQGVKRSVDSALAIITDLLDIAYADRGGLPVRRVPVDLAELTRETLEDYRAEAEAAGHTVEIPRSDEPLRTDTDPTRVRQVLGNLLTNAIKYTPAPGRISVRAERTGGGDGLPPGSWAVVRVSDSGPGIPAEMRESIFDEFMRLDEGAGPGGHGLGLAIARRIARMLGGDLRLEDDGGPGATFALWLPLRSDAEGADTGAGEE